MSLTARTFWLRIDSVDSPLYMDGWATRVMGREAPPGVTQWSFREAEFPWVVTDDTLEGPASLLGAFPTTEQASEFIGTLPDAESGRYGISGPAED